MKNITKILLVIILIFITSSCKAQSYPLDYKGDVPDGAYYKDTNNELDKFVGLWKGNWNGKTLYLELKKIKHKVGINSYTYWDMILGERKIVAANGSVEIDRISNFDNEHPEFWGMGINLKNGSQETLTFSPKNMCRKMAKLIITSFTTSQMTLHFEYEPSAIDPNCQHNAYVDQHGDFPINFPKDIVLTKQ
ncbi:hypothetical protein M2347_001920 [Chryseobacterium sp. H1D6B]|uniref:DUF6705 family protein n=1 Tax=Chryseobacterium sp. H1D6B TaxID=2940588 RepID=UPI0015C82CE4|nr:DUF6705 family protein [Chryseobacterium sp. H1D6B]MDH6252193.1 hypothetical protein [Chryseobacterium sp. H1D6B]